MIPFFDNFLTEQPEVNNDFPTMSRAKWKGFINGKSKSIEELFPTESEYRRIINNLSLTRSGLRGMMESDPKMRTIIQSQYDVMNDLLSALLPCGSEYPHPPYYEHELIISLKNK